MTIIHLISGLSVGGAEHIVLELCRQTKKRQGVRVMVVCISSIDTIAYKFREEKIELYFLGIDGISELPVGVKKFLKIIDEQQQVIIHAHMFHGNMLACAAKLFRLYIPVVFTLHNSQVREWHRKILICFTRFLRDKDIMFPGAKPKWYQKPSASLIGNGIDFSIYDQTFFRPDIFTFIFVGRLDRQKNPLFLVKLASQLRKKYMFRMRIVGDGPLLEAMKGLVLENNLSDCFEFLGWRKDIPHLLANAHCLLLPSLWEGMPLVILEAAASRLPIIATPVGSIPAICNSSNAYLGELGAFHLLSSEMMDDYALAMIRAYRLEMLVINDYTAEKMYTKHKELYNALLR